MTGRSPALAPPVRVTLGVSLLVRLVLAVSVGYGVDEAYAVTVARPLALSYFDHPPLHFWIAAVMAHLAHSVAPAVERLPFVTMFSITLWGIGRLTTQAFGAHAARVAVGALAISGVLGIVHGMSVLPDGPLLVTSVLGLLIIMPLLLTPAEYPLPSTGAWRRWLLSGVCFGLAGLSKYHAALLVGGVVTFLWTDASARRWWRTAGPWLALGVMLALTTPVWVWNATHHWASFAFQSARAVPHRLSLAPFAENVVGQLLWLLPWIAVPLIGALWQAARRGRADRARWLFLCVAIWPIGLFTAVTLAGSRGLPHWQAPGWLFVFPLLGAMVAESSARGAHWPHRWWRSALGATALLVVTLAVYISTPRIAAALHVPVGWDPAIDVQSWTPVVRAAQRYAARTTPAAPMAVRSWIQGGQLGAGAPDDQPVNLRCLCDDRREFAWVPAAQAPWTTVILADRIQSGVSEWTSPAVTFADSGWTITPLDTVAIGRGARVALYRITRATPLTRP